MTCAYSSSLQSLPLPCPRAQPPLPPGSSWLRCCLQAKTILIATGGRAVKLPIDGAEHAIISDQILNLPKLPKKLAVIGGGYIGLEFAGIYNNYGSEVHVVYRQVRPAGCSTVAFCPTA